MEKNNYSINNSHYNQLLGSIVRIAIDGLNEMYIPEKFEFAFKKKLVLDKIIHENISTRYTLINLIGLRTAEINNIKIDINLKDVINHHVRQADKYTGIGEIGLLLWAASLISQEEITTLLSKVDLHYIYNEFNDSKSKLTVELSWFLTGLLLSSTFSDKFKNSIEDLIKKVYSDIHRNYDGFGIFRHQGNNTFEGKLRGNVASFADQVYPIIAFSLYSQKMQDNEALTISKECAQKICDHQGNNGEWMWHYNSSNGKVISKYPVYSVHQDAMAPMALYAIQEASGINFEKYIFKGLDWLTESNALKANMINEDLNLIWRAIAPKKISRNIKTILNLFGINTKDEYSKLEIVKECWSYHLGWVLFAFSGRINSQSEITSNNIENKYFNNRNLI